jgi:hypothetical protein
LVIKTDEIDTLIERAVQSLDETYDLIRAEGLYQAR